MMLISATRSAVNMAANIQKVNFTDPSGTALMATPVGMRSWMTQG